MLDDNKISLWHEVLHNGQWITVDELLKSASPAPPPEAAQAPPHPSSGRPKLPRLHHRPRPGDA